MPPIYVEVVVNVPRVSGVFHYLLPEELQPDFRAGMLVEVPFGQQQVQGVITRQVEQPEVSELKTVTAVLDERISLTPQQIELAFEIQRQTLAPFTSCISLMLPAGISQLADSLFTLVKAPAPGKQLKPNEKLILDALRERGPLRGRQIDRALPRRNWRPAARTLVERGWLSREPVLPPPRVRPRYIRTAQLAVPPELVAPGMQ